MIRAVLTVLILCSSANSLGATADDAYQDAKSAYARLKGDEKRRALRHHWQNVAKKFEAVATRFPRSERAPEALFNAGELNNELSRFSAKDEDRESAKRSYRKLLEGWPSHKLADDASFALARVLADREGDPAGARKVLEAAVKTAGDKKKDITGMLAALPKEKETSKPAPVVAKVSASVRAAIAARPVTASPKRAEAPALDVAEAIRRAIKPLQIARGEDPTPAPQARRAPPTMRPDETEEAVPARDAEEAAVVEESEPVVASLAEKLRDVRVGARLPGNDDTETRSRFKKLAKEEGGAELSLAQQLGLKVRRVIVDAGHGGHDTGAIGPKGTREKDVSLAIAKKLAAPPRGGRARGGAHPRRRHLREARGSHPLRQPAEGRPLHLGALQRGALARPCAASRPTPSTPRPTATPSAWRRGKTPPPSAGVGDLQYILADLATKANTGESAAPGGAGAALAHPQPLRPPTRA